MPRIQTKPHRKKRERFLGVNISLQFPFHSLFAGEFEGYFKQHLKRLTWQRHLNDSHQALCRDADVNKINGTIDRWTRGMCFEYNVDLDRWGDREGISFGNLLLLRNYVVSPLLAISRVLWWLLCLVFTRDPRKLTPQGKSCTHTNRYSAKLRRERTGVCITKSPSNDVEWVFFRCLDVLEAIMKLIAPIWQQLSHCQKTLMQVQYPGWNFHPFLHFEHQKWNKWKTLNGWGTHVLRPAFLNLFVPDTEWQKEGQNNVCWCSVSSSLFCPKNNRSTCAK